MVGGELLTMGPHGEDHQGHDWGGRARENGDSRGMKICGWRRWKTVKILMMSQALIWTLVLAGKDLLLMNYILPDMIWVLRGADGLKLLTMKILILMTKIMSSMKELPTLEICRSRCARRKTCWSNELWSGCVVPGSLVRPKSN